VIQLTLASILSLLEADANPLAEDMGGLLPVHYAALSGHTDTLALFPALLSTPDRKGGRYPLHYAAMSSRMDNIDFLLSKGGYSVMCLLFSTRVRKLKSSDCLTCKT